MPNSLSLSWTARITTLRGVAGFCQRQEDQEFSGMTGAVATASPLATGKFLAGHGNYSASKKQQEQPNTRANTKLGWCFPGQAHLASAAAQQPSASSQTNCSPHSCISSTWWQWKGQQHGGNFLLLLIFISEDNSRDTQLLLNSRTSFLMLETTLPFGKAEHKTTHRWSCFLEALLAHLLLPALKQSVSGCCWRSRMRENTCYKQTSKEVSVSFLHLKQTNKQNQPPNQESLQYFCDGANSDGKIHPPLHRLSSASSSLRFHPKGFLHSSKILWSRNCSSCYFYFFCSTVRSNIPCYSIPPYWPQPVQIVQPWSQKILFTPLLCSDP